MEGHEESQKVVLLVDDDLDQRQLLKRRLQVRGLVVVEADSGDEALALISAGARPNFVLTDASMPGIDGRLLCSRLKKMPELDGVPVVVMSAVHTSAEDERVAEAFSKADRYLVKPITDEHLDLLIEKFLP